MQNSQSKLGSFTATGPASLGKTRAAAAIDFVGAAVLAMLIAPQPLIRGVLSEALPAPAAWVPAYVITLLLAVLVVFWLYLAFTVVTWGRSLSMYLLDLGVDAPTKPTLGEASAWAFAWCLAVVPALLGIRVAYDPATGWPARMSGMQTKSTSTS